MRLLRHLGGLLKEIFSFAMHNKAWWIVPMVIILLLLGVIIYVAAGSAPYMYTLF